jgi:hypothetical protein
MTIATAATPVRRRSGRAALLFVAIGLAIYGGLLYASERLLYRTGRSNPFFKIATTTEPGVDWVILGASHAMPLDFADFNAVMERETGLRILNLASPGTGPLYNRFVLEQFFAERRARGVLYVIDSFAFQSAAWNEERFADPKLLRRTPFDAAVARRLARYVRNENVDVRALLDYLSGFSKINNRERFASDIWEGETQFERVYRPSSAAVSKRIAYLYPKPPDEAARERYLQEFADLIALARRHEARVVVVKMPMPAQFRGRLPGEADFDAAVARLLAAEGVAFHDFSQRLNEPRFYFDTDHLNRTGLTAFFRNDLKSVLLPQ